MTIPQSSIKCVSPIKMVRFEMVCHAQFSSTSDDDTLDFLVEAGP